MSATSDSAAIRRTYYLLLTTVAVSICVAKIVGAENVIEPSRYAPPTTESFGAERADKPLRKWPATRPEPTPFFSSNDKSRWATVRSLVDNGTFVIGKRSNFKAKQGPFDDSGIVFDDEDYRTLDKVMNPETGEFFSSKPPLLTMAVAAEYWLLKKCLGWNLVQNRWPVMAVVLITFNVLPFLLFLLLFARLVERIGTTDFGKMFAFTVAAVGTFLTTFSMTLNNHGPAAYCVFFALYALFQTSEETGGESPFALQFAGFFAGLAAVLDLPAAAFSAALLLPLLYLRPGRTLLFFLPALLLPVLALLASNYAALGRWLPAYSDFGGPWYNYAGSHWAKLDLVKAGTWQAGIDFAQESKLIYGFHLMFGHHGWFSLTPVWLIALCGIIMLKRRSKSQLMAVLKRTLPRDRSIFNLQLVGMLTAVVSFVVIAFYIYKSNNYGGNTSGPRWLFWLIPLWLVCLVPAADRLGNRRVGRAIATICLGVSVLSVFYPAWNPWRSPWIMQLGERAEWFSYEVPPGK